MTRKEEAQNALHILLSMGSLFVDRGKGKLVFSTSCCDWTLCECDCAEEAVINMLEKVKEKLWIRIMESERSSTI